MKRFFLTLIVSFMACALSSAQESKLYIGGQIGATFATNKASDNTQKVNNFTFRPDVGITFDQRWMIGAKVAFSNIKTNGKDASINVGGIDFSATDGITLIGLDPYARYNVFNIGSVKAWLESDFLLDKVFSSGKSLDAFVTGFTIFPMLTYDIAPHFTLFTELNMLSLDLAYTKVKYSVTDTETTQRMFVYGFNVDASDLVSLNSITIGLIYTF